MRLASLALLGAALTVGCQRTPLPLPAAPPGTVPGTIPGTVPGAVPALDVTLVAQGDALFHGGPPGLGLACADCHGAKAQGDIGPDIVGKTQSQIEDAVSTVTMMSSFKGQLTPGDFQALAAYLQSLSS